MVPLSEAWDSGARTWSPATREAYANDLDDERTLVAVSYSVNRSKGDRDIAEWLPQLEVCRYASEWVAVKMRWQLSIDQAEHAALVELATDCQDTTVAPVVVAEVQQGPPPEAEPTTPPSEDGDYLFPPAPDLDCGEIEERNFPVRPGDPHGFDRDGNGIGCES